MGFGSEEKITSRWFFLAVLIFSEGFGSKIEAIENFDAFREYQTTKPYGAVFTWPWGELNANPSLAKFDWICEHSTNARVKRYWILEHVHLMSCFDFNLSDDQDSVHS